MKSSELEEAKATPVAGEWEVIESASVGEVDITIAGLTTDQSNAVRVIDVRAMVAKSVKDWDSDEDLLQDAFARLREFMVTRGGQTVLPIEEDGH